MLIAISRACFVLCTTTCYRDARTISAPPWSRNTNSDRLHPSTSSCLLRRARRELHSGSGQQRGRRVRRRGRQSDYREPRLDLDGITWRGKRSRPDSRHTSSLPPASCRFHPHLVAPLCAVEWSRNGRPLSVPPPQPSTVPADKRNRITVSGQIEGGSGRGLVEDCTENHACAQALCLHAGRPGRETQNRLQNFDWSIPILLFWLSFGHFTFVLKMDSRHRMAHRKWKENKLC